ncbi:MAG: S8 family serine peptidase [Nitrospirae bacterium]|nr:S8 family serine peptidase [Nitrospirota bacterium]
MLRLSVVLILLIATADSASAAETSYVPGEVLVKFKPGTPPETIERFGAEMKTVVKRKPNSLGIELLSLPPDLSVEEAVAAYRNHPDVLYAEPNYLRRAFRLPDDPLFNRQWGLHNTGQSLPGTDNGLGQPLAGMTDADIDAPEAWDITIGSSSVLVAVLDTGMDYTHPDLAPNAVPGWDFVGTQTCTVDANNNCNCTPDDPVGDNDPLDNNGHGTHVAGIIGAKGNNAIGVSGVNWDVGLMPLKILESHGCGSVEDEVAAVQYAVMNKARIINASFGSPGFSQAEHDAIAAADNAGILFVAAAGNDGADNDSFPIYPAGYDLPNVISVAAGDFNGRLASFSNFGKSSVHLAAPGDCVYSTMPTFPVTLNSEANWFCTGFLYAQNYDYLPGTSMAAPHVSGVAGLLLARNNSLTPAQIKSIISLTADPRNSLKGLVASGGLVNARKALLREAGSGLTGGKAGCGFPAGIVRPSDEEPTPPVQIGLFFFTLFWPLLIPMLRNRLRRRVNRRWVISGRRAGVASAAGLLALMIFWPQAVSAQADDLENIEEDSDQDDRPFETFHSIGLKLGYHRYDTSKYFDTNSGLLSRNDLSGLSGELEYQWRWREEYGLTVTTGRYAQEADLKNVCCQRISFSTAYVLITPTRYATLRFWKPVQWYIGGGIGYYYFKRKLHGLIEDRLTDNLAGIHAVIGLEWPVMQQFSILTEARYAVANVKSADAFDDSLNVGGFNYSLGLSWRFSLL